MRVKESCQVLEEEHCGGRRGCSTGKGPGAGNHSPTTVS